MNLGIAVMCKDCGQGGWVRINSAAARAASDQIVKALIAKTVAACRCCDRRPTDVRATELRPIRPRV